MYLLNLDDPSGDIVVALDIGSNITRIGMHNGEHKILASHGYPFDDKGPVYMGEARLTNRESVSLKYALYILANVSDKFVDQYPMIQKLRQHDSPAFRQKLRAAILNLLRTAREWALANMRKHWRIHRLCVNTPGHWGIEFHRVLLPLIGDAFKWNMRMTTEKVSFTFSTDSLTHYLLGKNFQTGSKLSQVWLVLQYGGHALVCDSYTLGLINAKYY